MFARIPPRAVTLGVVVLALATYEAIARGSHATFFFQPIGVVAGKLLASLRSGELAAHFGATMLEILASFVIGAGAGLAVGFAVGSHYAAREIVQPLLFTFFQTPLFVLYPVLIVWLGLDYPSKVAFGAVYTFFPVALSTIAGVESIDERLVALARVYGATVWDVVRTIRIPAAMPSIAAGLKTGISLAVTAVTAAEYLVSLRGMGFLIQKATTQLDVPYVYGLGMVTVIIALVLYGALAAVERRVRGHAGSGA